MLGGGLRHKSWGSQDCLPHDLCLRFAAVGSRVRPCERCATVLDAPAIQEAAVKTAVNSRGAAHKVAGRHQQN